VPSGVEGKSQPMTYVNRAAIYPLKWKTKKHVQHGPHALNAKHTTTTKADKITEPTRRAAE
jgi:hypothetical protein